MLQPFTIRPDVCLYLWNVASAALAISLIGLLALRLLAGCRPSKRHGFAVGVLLLILTCPILLGLSSLFNIGAFPLTAATAADNGMQEVLRPQERFSRDATDLSNPPERSERGQQNAPGSAIDFANGGWLASASCLAFIAWSAGTLLVAIRLIRGLFVCRRLRKASINPADSRLLRLHARACDLAQHDEHVPVLESCLVNVPLTFGVVRPVVVLPEGLAGILNDEELTCVLTHEAAHVARHDAAVAWLQQVCLCAFWWNPLLHAICRRLNRAREQICDDYVYRSQGAGDTFAAVLVKLAEWSLGLPQRVLPAAALFSHEPDDLPQRITRLTEEKWEMRSRLQWTRRGLLIAATVCMCTVAVLPTLRAQTKPLEPASPKEKQAAGKKTDPVRLSYHDDSAEGKKSIAGAAELISFTLPNEGAKLSAIRIHGSRYGYPQAPKEDFEIHFLNQDMSETVDTRKAPYSRFKRGPESWVEIKFAKPVEVPKDFWVGVDFNAERTKGIYLSFDKSTDGSRSRVGTPGGETREAGVGGDWMIEVALAEQGILRQRAAAP